MHHRKLNRLRYIAKLLHRFRGKLKINMSSIFKDKPHIFKIKIITDSVLLYCFTVYTCAYNYFTGSVKNHICITLQVNDSLRTIFNVRSPLIATCPKS